MDISPQDNTVQPISDDQDLAKALAGVSPNEPAAPAPSLPGPDSLNFGASPVAPAAVVPPAPVVDANPTTTAAPAPAPALNNLDSIKLSALKELQPLMTHVDLPPEEKFDTYLMLIRSTDDSSLIAPAHAAAQNITDEKKKAEALLEVIKEIDYLSGKGQQPTA